MGRGHRIEYFKDGKRLYRDVEDENQLQTAIDEVRAQKQSIDSVKPMQLSLEEAFTRIGLDKHD